MKLDKNIIFFMKKLSLLFIGCVVFVWGFSQDIVITLYQNSIKVHNDTLYFKYQIENKSDNIIVLYRTESVSVRDEYNDIFLKEYQNTAWPRLLATVIGPNNEYPTMVLPSVFRYSPPGTPLPQQPTTLPIKYIVLQPHQNVVYDNILIFNKIELLNDSLFEPEEGILHYFLSNGMHKFQLEYFSGKAFRKNFRKDKQQDIRLKNGVMFEGAVKSNICYFSYLN